MTQTLRDLQSRICRRPTTLETIRSIQQDLDRGLLEFYQARELKRAALPIDPEPAEYHRILHSLRSAISQGFRDHEVARMGVEHVRRMVNHGQLQKARSLSADLGPQLAFEDLKLGDVERLVRERELRQLKLVGVLIAIGLITLIAVAGLESMGMFERFTR